jgi:hypothetical protein
MLSLPAMMMPSFSAANLKTIMWQRIVRHEPDGRGWN